ncbi:transcriptional regulator [Achromobacter sp. MYb9]|uniref:transcriptional regulator n=1 Tax=Achromobacter sp. MYb9 TaxID=1827284 RepID=UPI000CFD342D|nr:transcriptional regulator [Achromobacter sp. MYb9]PQZ67633.1 transcriptional regulator [Achromobacter sp. MYb9]
MLTVIETDEFSTWAAKVWSDSEREAFVDWIAANPEAGDVIPGSGGCRKVRWSRVGMGKRGGARVIYYLRLASGEVVLLIVYAKAKFDNVPASFLAKLKECFDA